MDWFENLNDIIMTCGPLVWMLDLMWWMRR